MNPELIDALIGLRKRVVSKFCDSMEFKAFTNLAYQLATEYAEDQKPNDRYRIQYSKFAQDFGIIDREFSTPEVLQHFRVETKRAFPSLIHQHQVALFELMFFDILRLILKFQPIHLPENRKIDYSSILRSGSKEEILNILIERELNEVKYKKIPEWFSYLTKLNSNCKASETEMKMISEAKATRDLLVHNAGIVNKTYLEKSGDSARAEIGKEISVDGKYTAKVWKVMVSTLTSIIDDLTQSYK